MNFFSGSRSSKTFKPKKNIPEGSHQHDLMKHAAATLGSGKEDSNLEISLEALASQKPMLWAMKNCTNIICRYAKVNDFAKILGAWFKNYCLPRPLKFRHILACKSADFRARDLSFWI